VGSWIAALFAGIGGAGCLVLIHGCHCDAVVAYGVHDGDEVQTTIVGPPPSADQRPCTELDDWPPGTTLTWSALVVADGEGPGSGSGWLKAMTLDSVNGQAVARSPQGFVDAGSGCIGSLSLGIQALTSNPSVFDPTPDGGPGTSVLQRQFVPAAMEGGTCPRPLGECEDSFIARSKKL
jgi:hypothetical protein